MICNAAAVIEARNAASLANAEVARVENQYLRSRGWKATCDNPGSLWLWLKSTPDGTQLMLVDTFTAIRFEQDIDDDWRDEEPKDE